MIIFESYKLTEVNSLFEIPIYRLSPDLFLKELQEKLDKICRPLTIFEDLFPKNSKNKYDAHRKELELHTGYLWKFNEIIGWLLINIDQEILSGELFYKEGSRIRQSSKSKIAYNSEAFRFNITDAMTDLDIFLSISAELKGLNKKSTTNGRYIDINRFETIGKYISWRKLFVGLNS